MPQDKPLIPLHPNLQFWQYILICVAAAVIAGPANAQVDAGALQQNLEQQLPLPSPLALPQPGKPEPLQQTVPKDGSGIRELLEKWYILTECPMLLNTSLNIRGEPMVNDRFDADRFQSRYGIKVLS